MFGAELGPEAAKNIMKTVQQPPNQGTGHRKSVQLDEEEEKKRKEKEDKEEDEDNDEENEKKQSSTERDENGNMSNQNVKLVLLEKELAIKTEMVARMQLEIEDLRSQKFALLVNTNEAINQLRYAILACNAKQK